MIDNQLLESCRNGDEKSWRQLFSSLYPFAKWVARRWLRTEDEGVVEEIAQETMSAIVLKVAHVNDVEYLGRIVRRIARNKCVDYLRRNEVKFEELSEESEVLMAAPIPESIEDDVIVALRSAFMKLAETCKSILRSRFFAEKSYKEISAELGVDVNQVGVRISRCLVRLRVLLSAEGIQAEDVL